VQIARREKASRALRSSKLVGRIPKAVIPSPLAHAIGAGVWVATVASVALLANAATYFYLEYRLWNAWTRASLRHESQLSTSFDGDEKALRITGGIFDEREVRFRAMSEATATVSATATQVKTS